MATEIGIPFAGVQVLCGGATETKDYDYYFDFVKNLIEPFRTHEDKKYSNENQIQ